MNIERRSLGTLAAEAGSLVGYASVFNSLSEDLGGFKERIHPQAFNRSLGSGFDVRALVNHDTTLVLGRRSNNTLQLTVDTKGLKVSIAPPKTSYANDLLELVSRGDVSQMSFGFIIAPGGEAWSNEDGLKVRTVTDLDLLEVSVVSIPAYSDTTVALRNLQDWNRQLDSRLKARCSLIRRLELSLVIGGV